VSNTSVRF